MSALLLPNLLFSPAPPRHDCIPLRQRSPSSRSQRFRFICSRHPMELARCTAADEPPAAVDCVGTGGAAECYTADQEIDVILETTEEIGESVSGFEAIEKEGLGFGGTGALNWLFIVSPFFFWGTTMVAMKEVIPKTGPFFVSSFRLLPAGALLIAFAAITGRKQPYGVLAWLSITLFGFVDAACFQGFLAEGLQKTSAGLGSPLTVAILAALLFDESISATGAAGLVLGVVGLVLLEVPAFSLEAVSSSIWGSGEWWMLLAAQSMAVGTVMVRWVSKYSDPVMATGWHMVIGGLPLLLLSVLVKNPGMQGSLAELTTSDFLALFYTSVFGSAISYGVYFYNATRGSLTKLSSLTFLTPMFASIFGFVFLGETFSTQQLGGALVTLLGIYLVNRKE